MKGGARGGARTPQQSDGLLKQFVLNLSERVGAEGLGQEYVGQPPMTYREFIRKAWHIIEPGRPFVDGWHIGAICEHLEAVTRFEIRKLLINMPPRHMKSIAVSACLTPWVWTWAPIRRFFYASYDGKLSRRDNQKARDIVESDWYAKAWGDRVMLKRDQNEKDKFENTVSGYRFATSVGGRATGEGGDFVICDDPHNVKDVGRERDTRRVAVLDWWDNAIPSRLNDPQQGAFVIVAQRVHQADLSGHVLERDGWVHLCLPAEYEGRKYWTPLGFEDPRTEPGQLLWPARYDRDALDEIKAGMRESEYAGQYQQRPAPAGGAVFKWDWFRTYADTPRFERRVIFWDTAQKTREDNAYSCAQFWGESYEGWYLLDSYRARLAYPELKEQVRELYELWGADEVVIEDKSSGTSVIQDLQRSSLVPVVPYDLPGGDKTTRAKAQASTVKGGNVLVPEQADWLEDFKDEITTFPGSAYKDQVDVMSMALEYFQRGASLAQGLDLS
ncbi:MAG: phage terminase large subunit [Desulfovibrio sp.]|jgi:predicted phage terminase large subunit-like protein